MKTIIKLILAILIIHGSYSLFAQGFKSPSNKDKALVYFVRTSRMGFAINFKYFDSNKFIGIFNNKGYISYECKPGEHILWVVPGGGDDSDFIIAFLEAGNTYVIEAKATGKLNPLSPVDEFKIIENTLKIVNKKEEVTMSETDKEERTIKYQEYTELKLLEFNDMVKENYPFKRITSLEALPEKYINNKQ